MQEMYDFGKELWDFVVIINSTLREYFTIRPNVPYIKVSSRANSSIGGTDGTSR
jgi:hypothetical protein